MRLGSSNGPGRMARPRRWTFARTVYLVLFVGCLGLAGGAVYLYFRPAYYTPRSVGQVPSTNFPSSTRTTSAAAGAVNAPSTTGGQPRTSNSKRQAPTSTQDATTQGSHAGSTGGVSSPRPEQDATGAALGAPISLSYPALGVNARVIAEGLAADGTLAIPLDPRLVGWWEYGAPVHDSEGTVVIAGHVDTAAEGDGALFNLGNALPGQKVTLATTTGPATYTVVARHTYLKAELPGSVFDRTGRARLAIITCGGPFNWTTHHYADNVVVYALPDPQSRVRYDAAAVGPVHLAVDRTDYATKTEVTYSSAKAPPPGHGLVTAWGTLQRGPLRARSTTKLSLVFVNRDKVVGVRQMGRCRGTSSCSGYQPPGNYSTVIAAAPGTFRSVRAGETVSLGWGSHAPPTVPGPVDNASP